MKFNQEKLYVVGAELFTLEGLDTFKINDDKVEYIHIETPMLEINKDTFIIKDNVSQIVEIIKYEGYGRYVSLGGAYMDTLEEFMEF